MVVWTAGSFVTARRSCDVTLLGCCVTFGDSALWVASSLLAKRRSCVRFRAKQRRAWTTMSGRESNGGLGMDIRLRIRLLSGKRNHSTPPEMKAPDGEVPGSERSPQSGAGLGRAGRQSTTDGEQQHIRGGAHIRGGVCSQELLQLHGVIRRQLQHVRGRS